MIGNQRILRALMTGLLDAGYTSTQASHDVTRLRRNAIITKPLGTNTYDLTGDGLRFAIFYTKLHNRVLRPLFAADQRQARRPTRQRGRGPQAFTA
jgi:hypothetical protein